MKSILVLFFLSPMIHIDLCGCVDVEFRNKVVNDVRGSWFGSELATSPRKLVIGVHREGKIMVVDDGRKIKIRGPNGESIGFRVDVNHEFIITTDLSKLFVFEATHPYHHVASIHLEDYSYAGDIVISESSTIFIAHGVGASTAILKIYEHDGGAAWSLRQKIDLMGFVGGPFRYLSLALSGENLAVATEGHDRYGQVALYGKKNGNWVLNQVIKNPNPKKSLLFGGYGGVAIDGAHLAVTCRGQIVYTYHLDPETGKWVNNGNISGHRAPSVAIHNGILAMSRCHQMYGTWVCGAAYKLSEKTAGDYSWEPFATLTTKKDPLTWFDFCAIKVQDGLVFTGRWNLNGLFDDKVFIHDLSNI